MGSSVEQKGCKDIDATLLRIVKSNSILNEPEASEVCIAMVSPDGDP